MFPSQKKLINNIIAQSFAKTNDAKAVLKDVQIGYAFLYHHYALLVLAIGSIASYAIVYFSNAEQSKATSIWSLITLALVVVLFSYSYRLLQKQPLTIKHIHYYMITASVVIGACVAAGAAVLIFFHGLPVDVFHHTHVGYAVFVLILYVVILGGFGNHLLYVFLFLIVSLIPSIVTISQQTEVLLKEPFMYLYGFIFLIVYMVAAHEEYRIRAMSSLLYIEHWKTLGVLEKQTKAAQESELALLEESKSRQKAEKELQETNHMLEQKIADRTKLISNINSNLLNSKRSMEMAHEVAGLASWEWDIEKRQLTGTNFDVLLEYDKDEMATLLNNFYTLIHPDDEKDVKHALGDYMDGNTQKYHSIFRMKNRQGGWVWIDSMGVAVKRNADTKKPARMVGIVRDITLEKNVSDSLKLSNRVFEQSAESIFVLDANLNYISVNPSYEKVMGYTLEEIEGKPLFLWYENIAQNNSVIQKILHVLKTTGEYSGEITEKNKNGERVYLQLSINEVMEDDGKELTNYIGIFSDLTQQTEDKQKLSYLENYDQLTDLPNRTFFNQQLHSLLNEKNDKFAVIRINIDRFRVLNNSLGSKSADLLLKHVSERLSHLNFSVRALARMGADDFAVLFNHLSLHDLKAYLEGVITAFNQPFYIENKEVNVRLSLGVSLYPQHGHQVDALMNCAEQGLQRAKKNGGNEYFIYNQGLHVSSLDKLELENELRHAINKGELVVFYQPKVSLRSNSLVGFEALVRWHHPKKGLLLPNEFMGVAEETGLINELGLEVLSQACRQIGEWHDADLLKDMKVAVNVEAQQLKKGNFLALLDNALEITKVHPTNLEIEITESSIMDMPDKLLPLLTAIKARDISIAMDDFGTGYSSLAYLSQYPIDVIKIDQSFIHNLTMSSESESIVRAIIAMGQSLNMKLVAEGVENKEQIAFLAKEGCHVAQGYYYGKPAPPAQATKILERSVRYS